MDVPPKVQPVCLLALKSKEYITIMGVLPKSVLGNTTSSGYKLHIETIYLAINKMVELTYYSSLSQRFITNMLPFDVQSMLYLNKTLGNTALMGVQNLLCYSLCLLARPKQNIGLHCTHGCAT